MGTCTVGRARTAVLVRKRVDFECCYPKVTSLWYQSAVFFLLLVAVRLLWLKFKVSIRNLTCNYYYTSLFFLVFRPGVSILCQNQWDLGFPTLVATALASGFSRTAFRILAGASIHGTVVANSLPATCLWASLSHVFIWTHRLNEQQPWTHESWWRTPPLNDDCLTDPVVIAIYVRTLNYQSLMPELRTTPLTQSSCLQPNERVGRGKTIL